MSRQAALRLEYDVLGGLPVQVEAIEEQVTSDAGLLPIRALDERLGWTASFAAQLRDARVGGEHSRVEMVRQRVFGILADYPDQNDHDTLRADGLFKIIAGRRPDDRDLASQPTLSRMENAVTAGDLLRVKAWFLEQFVASFAKPPRTLTLDIDVFDDPTHGQQQLTFFYGYYSQYQYLVRAITCAENDRVVIPVLLFGTTHEPQRQFTALEYQTGSWDAPRWTIVKCEAHAQGTNRRAVVTNRRGARVVPQGAYDEYADRSESENRNKELKCELKADRLSDHRYLANLFRLAMHTLAYNLLVNVRRLVADPPAPPPAENELPPEARAGREKRKLFNRRRRADPLGEGHASTWRTQLIKVGARIVSSSRRVRVLLSAAWPFWKHFVKVTQAVLAFQPSTIGSSPPSLDSG